MSQENIELSFNKNKDDITNEDNDVMESKEVIIMEVNNPDKCDSTEQEHAS